MSRVDRTFRKHRMGAVGFAALTFVAVTPIFAGTLTVEVRKHDGTPLQGAVVTVEAESPTLPSAAPIKGIMDQMNLAFVPDVLVIPVHSTVQFPNSDAISHQVYSFSDAKHFQLPLYRGKPYPPVSFDQVGVATLGCNIHDNMLAYVVVTAAQFYGRSNGSGGWSEEIPAGRYHVRVWHPLLNEPQEIERTLQIGADPAAVDFKLTKNLRPAPLKGRPHSWDY